MALFLNYEQEALDHQLEPRTGVSDLERAMARNAELAAAALELRTAADVSYGLGKWDKLDVYAAPGAGAPLLIFCHGGGWQARSKEDAALLAPALTAAGIGLVTIDFEPVSAAHGLEQMVAQVRRAIAFIHANAAAWGADPANLHIAGHSSGAHLAAMQLADGWQAELGLPADTIKSAILLSGLYDLEPVRLSFRNQALRLSHYSARSLSPLHQLGHPRPLTVAWGDLETEEFQRQSRVMAEAAAGAGFMVAARAEPDCHHFNITLALLERDGSLYRRLMAQLGIQS
jgi:arylformamidase